MNFKKNYISGLLGACLILSLTGCGGGDSAEEEIAQIVPPECVTQDDENTDDNCGVVLVGVTDADGDFLSYNVTVTELELTRADGTQVSVMPATQTVNFADYVDVSELAAAATIPAGIYTEGSITIDYSNADIQVEKSGDAVLASMVDSEGVPLTTETLDIQLDEGNRLVVRRNRPAVIEVDFNLAASHTVDLQSEPVTVTTEPFIIAEVDPVFRKERRIRGPLLEVNQDESYYRIAVRPFHRTTGRFGGVNISADDQTTFNIDGEAYVGSEGLAQMAILDPETPTLTLGKFERSTDGLTAIMVLAGTSVPGTDMDGARGVIVARSGNNLTIKGASLVRTNGETAFNQEVNVLIADSTNVTKNRRFQDEVSINDLSIGQAVTILGTFTEQDGVSTLDASEGFVRMRLTSASGHSTSDDGATLTLDLQALHGRSPDNFDFSGTGMDESFDADPASYEISTANSVTANLELGDPIRALGFINAYGNAPADFNASTVINYSESRSQLVANWPLGDEVVAFNQITSEQLILNIDDGGEGNYKLIQGGIRTELSDFDSAISLSPLGERGLYTIKDADSIVTFSNFADFTSYLQLKLDEGKSIDLMHATGGFSSDTNMLSALKIAIKFN